MVFLSNKYYVCVGKYIIGEEEERQLPNGFLNTISYRDRNPSSWGAGGLYDYHDYQIHCMRERPQFTVGSIYKCPFNGRLMDNRNVACVITSENESNFVLIDFTIDPITEQFIRKADDLPIGFRITIEPCKLYNYDQDVYDRFHDLSMFQLWFKTTLTYYGGTYHSMNLYEGKESIRKACYDLWKKVRVHSKQCNKIINSAHLKKQRPYEPRYTRWGNDWSDVSSMYFPF